MIYAGDTDTVAPVKAATTSIPIVFRIGGDPVQLGLVTSINRPGGNLTGILSQVEGLPGKQVEIAQELVPAITLIGVLAKRAVAKATA